MPCENIPGVAGLPQSEPGHWAIQTGSFRRGKPIVDPQTGQSLGYEMEWVATPLADA